MKKKWQQMKNGVLGKKFDLSLVFAGGALMKKLNFQYRQKTYSANVLSFPLSANDGEIFINKKFTKNKKDESWCEYLFLHSLLHLKGFDHGDKMDKKEKELIKKFKINYKIEE